MDHWKGVSRDRDHTAKAWRYVRELGVDIVLLQEAAPPPTDVEANVLPAPAAAERWHSGGRAAFGTAVVTFGLPVEEVPVGPLMGARRNASTATRSRS